MSTWDNIEVFAIFVVYLFFHSYLYLAFILFPIYLHVAHARGLLFIEKHLIGYIIASATAMCLSLGYIYSLISVFTFPVWIRDHLTSHYAYDLYLGHVQIDGGSIFQAMLGIISEYFICLAIFAALWRPVNRIFKPIFANKRNAYIIISTIYLICYLAYMFGGPINMHSH